MIQWHPLFVRLLRPVVEDYYEIETNVSVGDVPREADLLLLRRTQQGEPPFKVLWKYLTGWNVVEYKGPTVSARVDDLPLLVELGLGIHRKINEKQAKEKQPRVAAADVSFWYVRHNLGTRFRNGVQRLLGANVLERVAEGIWMFRVFDHLLYLVDGQAVPFGRESFPLQFLHAQPAEWEMAAVPLVLGDSGLRKSCASLLPVLHPGLLKEIVAMARTKTKWPQPDLEPLVELMGGMEAVVRKLGVKRVIDEVGVRRVLDEVGVKRVIDEVGVRRVLDEVGVRRVLDEVGLETLLGNLSASEKRELKRRLAEQ